MQSNVWARPEMLVTFRAEIMNSVTREERTFRIKKVLRNGRVELYDIEGEFRETAFEALNFLREKRSKG
jgi:3-dehydroquinate dehydratase